MKFLVERVLVADCDHVFGESSLDLLVVAAHLLLVLLILVSTDGHVKLSNLVSILTGGWHFYGSCPIEIEVAERVGQLLNLKLCEIRLVERHMEVGR